ncbi:hypothetical protein CRE_28841 [Caenorhabditis remanei]|uniref:F-box domain-containing protein n=1 Tax=Caenorhabditis remanei TaxID=31234 RepID=E3MXB5_CAERE|nr:hypothetical protein CRE_28841 [Caenorhabditis remanei]
MDQDTSEAALTPFSQQSKVLTEGDICHVLRDCKPFHLHRLPLLAFIPIVQSMEPVERFKLSHTSKRMLEMMKTVRSQLDFVTIVLKNDEAVIECKDDENEFHVECSAMGYMIVGTGRYQGILLLKPGSIAVNTARAFEKIIGAFKVKDYGIAIRGEAINTKDFSELLAHPIFQNWLSITIDGISLKTEDLNLVMDRADSKKFLEISNCVFPKDFKHENAFKFANNDYNDARWLSLEDAMKIESARNVTLGYTSFNIDDLKAYLKHVVENDKDLFEWMLIGVHPWTPLQDLFEGMLVLEYLYPFSSLSFFLANSASKTRKSPVIAIHRAPGSVTLSSWSATEPPLGGDVGVHETFKDTLTVLRLLDERSRLEKIVEEKNKDSVVERHEIMKLTQQMESLNVVFEDGRAYVLMY